MIPNCVATVFAAVQPGSSAEPPFGLRLVRIGQRKAADLQKRRSALPQSPRATRIFQLVPDTSYRHHPCSARKIRVKKHDYTKGISGKINARVDLGERPKRT